MYKVNNARKREGYGRWSANHMDNWSKTIRSGRLLFWVSKWPSGFLKLFIWVFGGWRGKIVTFFKKKPIVFSSDSGEFSRFRTTIPCFFFILNLENDECGFRWLWWISSLMTPCCDDVMLSRRSFITRIVCAGVVGIWIWWWDVAKTMESQGGDAIHSDDYNYRCFFEW